MPVLATDRFFFGRTRPLPAGRHDGKDIESNKSSTAAYDGRNSWQRPDAFSTSRTLQALRQPGQHDVLAPDNSVFGRAAWAFLCAIMRWCFAARMRTSCSARSLTLAVRRTRIRAGRRIHRWRSGCCQTQSL